MKKIIKIMIICLTFLTLSSIKAEEKSVMVKKIIPNILTDTKAYQDGNKTIMNAFGAEVEYEIEIENPFDFNIKVKDVSFSFLSSKEYIVLESVDETGKIIPASSTGVVTVLTKTVANKNATVENIDGENANVTISFVESGKSADKNKTVEENKTKEENKTIDINKKNESDSNKTNVFSKNESKGEIENSKTLDNVGIYVLLIIVAALGAILVFVYIMKTKKFTINRNVVIASLVVCLISGIAVYLSFASDKVIEITVPIEINYQKDDFLKNTFDYTDMLDMYEKVFLVNFDTSALDFDLENEAIIQNQKTYQDFMDFWSGVDTEHLKPIELEIKKINKEEFKELKDTYNNQDSNLTVDSIFDLSENQNGNILAKFTDAYYEPGNKNCDYYSDSFCRTNYKFKKLTIYSINKIYLNENANFLTSVYFHLQAAYSIKGIENLDSSYTKQMVGTFVDVANDMNNFPVNDVNPDGYITLDLSNFDTSNVKYMFGTFASSNIENLILNKYDDKGNLLHAFDTSNVIDMSYMFDGFDYTTDVSLFDTSNVKYMYNVFNQYGTEVTKEGNNVTLDLRKWDVSNVITMNSMFHNIGKRGSSDNLDLVTINVSNWDARKVLYFTHTFANSGNIITSEGNNTLKTRDAIEYDGMFHKINNSILDISGFDTEKAKVMSQMFMDDDNLETIYVGSSWNVNNVEYSSEIFGTSGVLTGQNGTKCYKVAGDSNSYITSNIDKSMAHIDEGESNPGCLSSITNN